jgi:threonine dehydrogenase-like Zn-dependent dehydrogenase
MPHVAFEAQEYHSDGSIRPARYAFRGDVGSGWEVERNGTIHLRLGPGYRLVETARCGICSTDLARRFLPFPLPQITGHEAVARLENGTLAAVEINASHAARGVVEAQACDFCSAGLDRHCPERLVLGIHDLPGGFGPWMLVPLRNLHPLPPAIPEEAATFVEPFAAALHAVATIDPRTGDTIAVLGARKLGSMLVAALVAHRERTGKDFAILSLARRETQQNLARVLGADKSISPEESEAFAPLADVVIDATGSPDALPLAARLARREVHVKSTSGRETFGLRNLTAFVVDELSLVPGPGEGIVAHTLTEIDHTIRPHQDREIGLVCARGTIAVPDVGQAREGILEPLLARRIRFTSTRCGDFPPAIDLLADERLSLAARFADHLVTDVFPSSDLAKAFARAADPETLKVAVVPSHLT